MNKIEEMEQVLAAEFLDATTGLHKPMLPAGFWMLDITIGKYWLVVDWREKDGFGLSSREDHGYGEPADERYANYSEALARCRFLLSNKAATEPGRLGEKPVRTVVMAPTDRVDELKPYVKRVIKALGLPWALVTDQSKLGDFRGVWQEKTDAEAVTELSGRLGFLVSVDDHIHEVAARLKASSRASHEAFQLAMAGVFVAVVVVAVVACVLFSR